MSTLAELERQIAEIKKSVAGRGRGPRSADVGVHVSSIANVVVPALGVAPGADATQLLRINHSQCREFDGLCTVHIAVKDGAPSASMIAGIQPNSKLIAHVQWSTGLMVGACDLDITGGAIFTCAGTQGIRVDCEQVSADEGIALNPGTDLILNAACAWMGQAAPPRAGFMTGLRQIVTAGNPSAAQLIPDNAQNVHLVSNAVGAVLTVNLLSAAGGAVIYTGRATLQDPGGARVAIVAGARRYTVTSDHDSVVTAVFDMVI